MLRPLAIAAILAFAGSSLAANFVPPTDEQIDAFITAVDAAGKAADNPAAESTARADAVKGRMGDISWNEVTPAQFDKLALKGLMLPYPSVKEASHERLKELAKLPTVEGARCADILVACWPMPKDPTPEAMKEMNAQRLAAWETAMKHPAIGDLFKAGKGANLIRVVPQYRAEAKSKRMVETLEPFINTDLSPMAASSLWSVLDIAQGDAYADNPALVQRIREKVGRAAEAAIDKDDPRYKDDPKLAESTRKTLVNLRDMCNSAWAKGELLDHQAPPINFTWTNSPSTLKSFADLKGKVVIVDFWATWCGPCVASFPTVRALAARYKDYPVAIVGVTSQQGYHISRKDGKTEKIDCEGDFKKECDLMSEFIKDMDMTWTVAFSDKNCFNPDFGVRGIPHVAIITPDGKVRFNELRPGNVAEEAERIDELLKEFKLPHPTVPVASVEPKGP